MTDADCECTSSAAQGSQAVTNSIRSATSSDGLKWTMDPRGPRGIRGPQLRITAHRLFWTTGAAGCTSVRSRPGDHQPAYRSDGLEFHPGTGPENRPGRSSTTRSARLPRRLSAWQVLDYVMYYAGYSQVSGSRASRADIFRAVSGDGLTWTKESEPVISSGARRLGRGEVVRDVPHVRLPGEPN
jgi:hypothetical protein